MTLILSGTDGLSDVDGSAATPAIRGTDANTGIFFGADIIGFAEGGAEVARFNADAQFVAAAGTASLPVITTTGDVNTGIFFPAADTIAFSEGGVESARIDSAGNFGLGVTPSAGWNASNNRAIQLLGYGSISSNNSQGTCDVAYNCYNSTTQAVLGWKYTNSSAAATLYQQLNGIHAWHIAPSGTADAAITFTQAMTLDASGNLGIGNTSPTTLITSIGGGGGKGMVLSGQVPVLYFEDTNGTDASIFVENGDIAFVNGTTEAARFSSGNLLVGATSGGSYKLQVETTGINTLLLKTNTNCTQDCWQSNTVGNNLFIQFYTETSATLRGSISYNRAGGVVAYNTTSDYRAKDISGPVTGSGALIDSTPVYMGKMKGATQERPMFIAHEVPAYAHTGEKDAVDKDGNPVYQQMDASALIPVMWAEIQSLRKRLATLESA